MQRFDKISANGIRGLIPLLLLLALPAAAQTFPKLTGRVVDDAHLLPEPDRRAITAELAQLERASGHQFVVVTVPTLKAEPIERYGMDLGNFWGIGRRGYNDGVLLIVAPRERKVRIEVGKGLERTLTDAEAAVIIQRDILPAFKAGDFVRGIHGGVSAIIHEIAPAKRLAA